MTYPIKLALLILSLGASAVQASPQQVGSPYAPTIDSEGPWAAAVLGEMTTSFGNAAIGFTLHSVVYKNDWGSRDFRRGGVFYQITNTGSQAVGWTIDRQFEFTAPVSSNGAYPDISNPWDRQFKDGFGSFVDGTYQAEAWEGTMGQGGDDANTVIYTHVSSTTHFNDGTDYMASYDPNDLEASREVWLQTRVFAPGASSYIGGVGIDAYKLGTVNISGVEVAAFVPTIPEPETYALMLAGLGLIGNVLRRRKLKQGDSLNNEGSLV
jgi:hypothetical protein